MKNKDLKVQPIRKYKTPKYPSYLDKNPIDHPETLPYPFKAKMLHGLFIMGLVATPYGFAVEHNPDVDNPFPFKATGLPHMPAMFGTGLPESLSSKEARSTILKVFKEAGIPLQEDYAYTENGQYYTLDGYNPKKKIGFAWLNYSNLNNDNFDYSWRSGYRTDKLGSSLPNRVYSLKSLMDNVEGKIYNEQSKKYYDRIAEIEEMKDVEIRKAAFTALRYEFLTYLLSKKKIKTTPKLAEAAQKAFLLPSTKQYDAFEKITHRHELHIFTIPINRLLSKEYSSFIDENILKFTDKEFKRHSKNVDHLIELGNNIKEQEEKKDLITAIQQFGKDNSLKALETAIDEARKLHTLDFSIEEIKHLEEQTTTDKVFIAPISQYDHRYQYYGYYNDGAAELPEEVRNKIKKEAEKIDNRQEQRAYYDKAIQEEVKKRNIETPKQKTLNELEKQVRQYIRWAKSQGMY